VDTTLNIVSTTYNVIREQQQLSLSTEPQTTATSKLWHYSAYCWRT